MIRTTRRTTTIKDDIKEINKVVHIDDAKIRNHLDVLVKDSVEETLNALLDAEADRMCGAQRYERSADRVDGRAGHYERKLHTKAGEVNLKAPKLRRQTFETGIIERYKRREASVEEALIEMYLAGVSVRRVEDITEALWGTRVSSGTVSKLNQKIYGQLEQWRQKPIEGDFPYVLPRWYCSEAQLGWRDTKCISTGCHRCEKRRIPRYSRGSGG